MTAPTKVERQGWRDCPREGVQAVKELAYVVGRTLSVSEHAVLIAALADVGAPHAELLALQPRADLPELPDDLPDNLPPA